MDCEKQDVVVPTLYGSLDAICKTRKIVQDNNSYFRSISQVICGSQKSHRKVRTTVLRYMENHSDEHIKLIGKEYSSISDYINTSQMKYVGNRATEIEIQATANAFGIDIFTHTGGKWLKYSTMRTRLSNEAIYLHFSDNSHCEPMVCVQPINKKSCYGVCKPDSLSDTQYMSRGE